MTRPKDGIDYPVGFVVGGEFKAALNRLTIYQKGLVLDALLRDLDGEPLSPEMDAMSLLMFDAILPSVHRLQKRKEYLAGVSRSNGMGGGRPKKDRSADAPPPETDETDVEQEEPTGYHENPLVSEKTHGLPEKPVGFDENPERHSTQLNSTELNSSYLNGSEHTPPYPPEGGVCAREGTQAPPKKSRARKAPDLRAEDFEQLWEKYPRHRGKEQARKTWDKLAASGELPDQMTLMGAVAWQASDWKEHGREEEHIPHLSTWLNGKLWNDEQPKVALQPRPWLGAPRRMSKEQEAHERNVANVREYLASVQGGRQEEPHD